MTRSSKCKRGSSEDPAKEWFEFPDLEYVATFPNLDFIASFPDFELPDFPDIGSFVDDLLLELPALDFDADVLAGLDDYVPVFDANYDLQTLVW